MRDFREKSLPVLRQKWTAWEILILRHSLKLVSHLSSKCLACQSWTPTSAIKNVSLEDREGLLEILLQGSVQKFLQIHGFPEHSTKAKMTSLDDCLGRLVPKKAENSCRKKPCPHWSPSQWLEEFSGRGEWRPGLFELLWDKMLVSKSKFNFSKSSNLEIRNVIKTLDLLGIINEGLKLCTGESVLDQHSRAQVVAKVGFQLLILLAEAHVVSPRRFWIQSSWLWELAITQVHKLH